MIHFVISNLLFCLIGWIIPLSAESAVNQNTIPVHYQLMDQGMFEQFVVNNTIAGVTSNSHSLYLLYFAKDGTCELWKKNITYPGTWWVEKDEQGRDFMRAFWPEYSSSYDPSSSQEATSAWYYVDVTQPDTLLLATKTSRETLLLLPGKTFPTQKP